MLRRSFLSGIPCALAMSGRAVTRPVVINDDGGWCWFEDERVLLLNDRLIVGTIAGGVHDPARMGDVDVATYDLRTRTSSRFTLHHSEDAAARKRWFDDHDSPAFLVRPDGRLLAMYARHGNEAAIYYRISSAPGDASSWGEERRYVPSAKSRVTYSNLHLLRAENGGKGRIYDFFRGLDDSFKPSYAWSDDFGETWNTGNVFIDVPLKFRHRPYVKYASNGRDTVHIAYTDGHPRDFDNSIYHICYRGGQLFRSDGTPIRSLKEGLKSPEEGTRVFPGDPNNVAWISDIHLDAKGRPALVFSVQKDSAGLPSGQGGEDHRYHYARWDGSRWARFEIAHGGSRLYAGEDDYTGNIALDPQDPNTVYFSTNADPATGKPLASRSDGQRHWELFRARTADGGKTWKCTAVTQDSTEDNIRPIVPIGPRSVVLWLRGKMRAYTDYRFEVVTLG